jgi:hypothetical protein
LHPILCQVFSRLLDPTRVNIKANGTTPELLNSGYEYAAIAAAQIVQHVIFLDFGQFQHLNYDIVGSGDENHLGDGEWLVGPLRPSIPSFGAHDQKKQRKE